MIAPVGRLPAPGAHGGDAAAVAGALGIDPRAVLDLSQSLNPVAPDPAAVVAGHLDALHRYPDPRRATAALAHAMGVAEERLLLTNGGAEAIALLAAELGGRVDEPEFSLHPRGGGVVWRSNPHNPSGRLAGPEERADVWDEAFYPLATGRWTRGDDHALVVGSLTKLLACPGLRVGYVLVPSGLDPPADGAGRVRGAGRVHGAGRVDATAILERCRARQPVWAVNGLAASALPELLDTVDLTDWARRVAALRHELVAVLRRHGLEPRPSEANWVLVEGPALRDRLAPLGIVVRDCTSFDLPGITRIAVPDEDGLQRLEAALKQIDDDP